MGHLIANQTLYIPKSSDYAFRFNSENNDVDVHLTIKQDNIIASKQWVKEHLDEVKKWSES